MQILSRSPSAPATPSVTSTLTGIHQPEQADPEGGAAPVRATRSELRRRGVAVALLVFVIFFVSPNTDGGDGYLVVPTAHSLIHEHNLDLSEFRDGVWYDSHYAVSEVDGRVVNYFPWLTAVFAVPVVASFDLLHTVGLAGDQATAINNATIQLQNRLAAAIVATAAAIVLALIARRLLMLMEATRPLTSDAAQAPRSSWLRSDGDWTFVVFTLVLALGTSLWSTASRSMW
ncbi:MAG TPA: hypothetical protein VL068_10010, partial [Microthrixaceae bacterium]|nr:hypothetical protein [Microthrixaceae bacterium]